LPRSSFTPHLTYVFVFAGLTLAGLAVVSPQVLFVAALDMAMAAVIMVPPILAGLWIVPVLRLEGMPLRWHFLIGATAGLGGISLLVLLLGLAGALQSGLWIALLGLFAVLGVIRVRILLGQREPEVVEDSKASHWSWMVLVPFLVLALLAASNPPGFIWAEEGHGYDVLEYHLQIPKEYLQAGRIAYVPHNVYANFPMNVEMLYLLAMIVHNHIIDLGTTANMIHLLLGALAVYAVWVIGREWSPRAGQIGAIALATVGWLGYLSGLAYVEHGMLFFGATASGALLKATAHPGHAASRRWLALSGACSGLACGCKYTAAALIALPLAVALILSGGGPWRKKGLDLSVYLVTTGIAFSPWLVKNALMTGNPVFPLANRLFDGRPLGWSEEEAERWNRGHTMAESDRSLGHRLNALWRHVPADHEQRFGPAIILLGFAGLLARRLGRLDALLFTILVIQVLVWMFATHLYARFTVPMLIPLSVLAGRAVLGSPGVHRVWIVGGILLVGAGWNFVFAARLHAREGTGGAPASLIYDGALPGVEYYSAVNHDLPANANVLMIGDARAFYMQRALDYCVIFNSSPFVEIVEKTNNTGDVLQALRDRKYTHILVHWHEIARLRRTYGFSPKVTPDLFDRLETAGLKRLREFSHPDVAGRWVELYEIPSN